MHHKILLWVYYIVKIFFFCVGNTAYGQRRAKDDMHYSDKEKLQLLAEELVVDAVKNIKQVDAIRAEHDINIGFEIGYIIGIIREKYRRLMAHFKSFHDRDRGRTKLYDVRMEQPRPVHLFIQFEWMNMIELEIEKLVELLESIPDGDLQIKMPKHKSSDIKANAANGTTLPPGLTIPTESTYRPAAAAVDKEQSGRKNLQIENLKSRMREQYLLKKLGLPAHMSTTKKRFINRWPVEDTWNEYNMNMF